MPATTTRPARASERHGVDYLFVQRAVFQRAIRAGAFVDWDYLLHHYYGYTNDLRDAADAGRDLVVPVVARMALRLAQILPMTFLLFLDDDDAVLERKLAGRALSWDERRLRKEQNDEEREHSTLFDLVVPDAAELSVARTLAVLNEILVQNQA